MKLTWFRVGFFFAELFDFFLLLLKCISHAIPVCLCGEVCDVIGDNDCSSIESSEKSSSLTNLNSFAMLSLRIYGFFIILLDISNALLSIRPIQFELDDDDEEEIEDKGLSIWQISLCFSTEDKIRCGRLETRLFSEGGE